MLAVAVSVSPSPSVDGRGEDDQAGRQRRRRTAGLDRVERIVVGDRPVLLEADCARRRVEVDGEGHRAGGTCR